MAHFSNNSIKLRQNMIAEDAAGQKVEYRASMFIQFKTNWDDDAGRYERMTDSQQKICDDFHAQMADAGVEIGFVFQKQMPGETELKNLPKIMTGKVYVNKRKEQRQKQQQEAGGNNGW